MQDDPEELARAFPGLHELWLIGPDGPSRDLLAVANVPPREVPPAQRHRLLARALPEDRDADLRPPRRPPPRRQPPRWLEPTGRFALSFRRHAVKLFERAAAAPARRR